MRVRLTTHAAQFTSQSSSLTSRLDGASHLRGIFRHRVRDFLTRLLIKDFTDKGQENLYIPCFEVIKSDRIINRVYARQEIAEDALNC